MKMEFQYEFEDYREAQVAHAAAAAQPTEKQKSLVVAFMFASVGAYIALAGFYAGLFDSSQHWSRFRLQLVSLIPWISILTWLWMTQFLASRRVTRVPWEATYVPAPKAKTWRSWKRIASPAMTIIVLTVMICLASRVSRPDLSDVLFAMFCFATLPWQIYTLWVVTLQKATAGCTVRRVWERLPQRELLHTMTVTEQGIVVESAINRDEHKWQGIIGYLETANLFLLYTSPLTYHMAPKRSFTADSDLDQFCGMLQRNVAAGRFIPRPSGFPVQPAAAIPRPVDAL